MFNPNDAPEGYVAIPAKNSSNYCLGCDLRVPASAYGTPEGSRRWHTCIATTTRCHPILRADRCNVIFIKRNSPLITNDLPEEIN